MQASVCPVCSHSQKKLTSTNNTTTPLPFCYIPYMHACVCVCVCAETRTACPCEIYKARAATLSTQGENDLERKGVLYLDLPAAKLQVTLPKHRRGCCFQVLHKCYYTQCQSTLHKSQVPDIAIYPLPHPKPGWLKRPTKA